MTKEKQIEEMAFTEIDILANDLNHHCADLAENYCGGTTCLSCLAHALTDKGYRKASEVAREVIDELETKLLVVSHRDTSKSGCAYSVDVSQILSEIEELRRKYTQEK